MTHADRHKQPDAGPVRPDEPEPPPVVYKGNKAEAPRERRARRSAHSSLEDAVRRGAADLRCFRQEAAMERQALRNEVASFKVDVDQRLKAMADAKQRSERIVEALPVGIAYVDPDLTCRWVNEAFLRMMERTRGQIVGQPLLEAFPEAHPQLGRSLRRLFCGGSHDKPLKLAFVHAVPGRAATRHWDLLAMPLLGSDSKLDGILLALDVTERVERQRRQTARIAKLTELDRLKGDFISMVSHELRTPLASIAGYAEFLGDETAGALTASQRSYVQAIQTAEERVRAIVDDLLDFAHIEAGTFQLAVEPVDVVKTVQHALTILLPAGQTGRVTVSMAEGPPRLRVLADPERLLQVLMNVVGNAIKFTPPGGRVCVTVTPADAEARVTVHDTGIGIPKEALPRVFDRFYQVDSTSTRARGGVGLGLAIAKSLVERQGGQMGVVSEPGRGTTFWFTLPLCEASVG